MPPLQCVNCGSSLTPGDSFCGDCGTAVSVPGRGSQPSAEPFPVNTAAPRHAWAGTAAQPPQPPRAPAAAGGGAGDFTYRQPGPEPVGLAQDEFFNHAMTQPDGPLSNSTRYLCAAAYLDPTYAKSVIGELVMSHRGVAPSLGIDLIPIIRHCLHARQAQLVRDLLLTVILIIGLLLATVPIIAILIISFFLSFLPGVQWERRSLGAKVLVGLGVGVVVAAIAVFYLVSSYFNQANGGASPRFGPLASGLSTLAVVLVFLGLLGAVLVGYSYSMYRTFSDRLRPGASAHRFERASEEVEERIAQVATAQRGNLTIYGGNNPFIGTGPRLLNEDWSIAIELDRAPGPGRNGGRRERGSGSYVPIDPVELHQVIRARLLKVKDEGLPQNERITALSMHDHVAGDGHCRWDSPFIDQARTTPYSQASPEAIDALIRHPAAGLRYYLRVCVSDEGQPVWVRRREVIGSTDQEIAVSAFIYVAVEGRMFYLQFVPTLLPPIYQRYHIVDRLPSVTSGEFMVKVILNAASTSFKDIVRAPFGVLGTAWTAMTERRSYHSEARSASDYVFADIGARISVRETGGSAQARTYIQVLDTVKYTRVVQRLVLDTVLDFLTEKGVDTSTYQESASAIISNSYTIHGNVGAIATGTHGQAEGRVHAPSGASAGSPKS
ncbi:MAG: zinc ribbon domain-containing protein [Streptosporangiaceae bacterium]